MHVAIDMGHGLDGYPNSGAKGIISESVETRNLGNRVMKLLQEQGNRVINCTVDYPISNTDSINKRVAKANAQPSDLFVSIHFNAGKGVGTEVLTANGEYLAEADKVLKGMEKLGFRNRGIKDGTSPRRIGVINSTKTKAMLIEVCFVDTQSDVDLYRKNIDKIAEVIAEGITGKSITSDNKEEIKNIGVDEDMIPTIKLSACNDSKIKNVMIEHIKGLQSCVNMTQTGVATQELCIKLPKFKGGESKGSASILQDLLYLKGYISNDPRKPPLGNTIKNALDRFKKDKGIPLTDELTNCLVWRCLLEY